MKGDALASDGVIDKPHHPVSVPRPIAGHPKDCPPRFEASKAKVA